MLQVTSGIASTQNTIDRTTQFHALARPEFICVWGKMYGRRAICHSVPASMPAALLFSPLHPPGGHRHSSHRAEGCDRQGCEAPSRVKFLYSGRRLPMLAPTLLRLWLA